MNAIDNNSDKIDKCWEERVLLFLEYYAKMSGSFGFDPFGNGGGYAGNVANEGVKKTNESLDERYLIVGTKVTFKASNAIGEITDVITGKVKVTINKIQTDWMSNSELQKEIKEKL
jgi:hypothetical protein